MDPRDCLYAVTFCLYTSPYSFLGGGGVQSLSSEACALSGMQVIPIQLPYQIRLFLLLGPIHLDRFPIALRFGPQSLRTCGDTSALS